MFAIEQFSKLLLYLHFLVYNSVFLFTIFGKHDSFSTKQYKLTYFCAKTFECLGIVELSGFIFSFSEK